MSWICVCFPTDEKEIRQAARDGKVEELLAGTDCSSCMKEVQAIVEDELNILTDSEQRALLGTPAAGVVTVSEALAVLKSNKRKKCGCRINPPDYCDSCILEKKK